MFRCLVLTALLLGAGATVESREKESAKGDPVEKTELLATTSESKKQELLSFVSESLTEKTELLDGTAESPTEITELLDETSQSPTEKKKLLDDKSESQVKRERFFLGAYQTTLQTLVSFTTSTVYPSCLASFATGNNCPGRRRRRSTNASQETYRMTISNHPNESGLASSNEHSATDLEAVENDDNTFSERFFTVWTKVQVTTTLTTYTTNTATTLSLSYGCSVGTIDVPLIGC